MVCRILPVLIVLAVWGTAEPARADAPDSLPGATTVDAAALVRLAQSEPPPVIIDARSRADYRDGHIPGAVLLTDSNLTTPAALEQHAPDRAGPVLFYCNGLRCGRAAKAAAKAVDWGWIRVYYYARGLEEWRSLGLPLERD